MCGERGATTVEPVQSDKRERAEWGKAASDFGLTRFTSAKNMDTVRRV